MKKYSFLKIIFFVLFSLLMMAGCNDSNVYNEEQGSSSEPSESDTDTDTVDNTDDDSDYDSDSDSNSDNESESDSSSDDESDSDSSSDDESDYDSNSDDESESDSDSNSDDESDSDSNSDDKSESDSNSDDESDSDSNSDDESDSIALYPAVLSAFSEEFIVYSNSISNPSDTTIANIQYILTYLANNGVGEIESTDLATAYGRIVAEYINGLGVASNIYNIITGSSENFPSALEDYHDNFESLITTISGKTETIMEVADIV